MPTYLHPGVYVEEIPSGVKPIEGVATSVAAFVGHTTQGPIGEPVLIQKFDDYKETFGGVLSATDAMGLAVSSFYLNGGKSAYIARLASNALVASLPANSLKGKAGEPAAAINVLAIDASSAGDWGDAVHVKSTTTGSRFKLEVGYLVDGTFEAEEVFDNLSMDDSDTNYVVPVVNSASKLIKVDLSAPLKADLAATAPGTPIYLNGTSVSGDLSGLTWGEVPDGAQLTVNIDNLGAETITLEAPPPFANGGEVAAQIQTQVRALGPEPAYSAFTCGFASDTLTLTSGTRGASSAVVVRAGSLATQLKLGTAAGGTETHGTVNVVPLNMAATALAGGDDGNLPGSGDYQSLFAKLKKVRDVSIIVLPGQTLTADGTGPSIAVIGQAIAHCEDTRSRMVILDPPVGLELDDATKVTDMGLPTSTYTVLYYPWIKIPNPFYNVDTNPTAPTALTVAPSGFAAGMWSKIDGRRGVWKAPAGVETALLGVAGFEFIVEDGEQDQLNPLGVNCLRKMPNFGPVVWGARTLSTKADPEWRYVPVRRTAIFIERSLYEGIQWAVFEPNNHLLWSALRVNIGSFMDGLFRAGAFQGEKASDAYFVRCGLGDTMTQGDIDRGQVIAIVGFAPLKPAEFVIVRIQQKVGQE